jgi:LacI family transcriptional regulator
LHVQPAPAARLSCPGQAAYTPANRGQRLDGKCGCAVSAHRQSNRPTLRDVAALAGVDPSSVSRVINSDPQLSITDETRNRILAAVEKLGYRSNMLARGLRMARTFTIGLVLPSIRNPMYVSIVQGVQARAEELGYGIVLGSAIGGQTSKTFAELLQHGRVDGLLIASGMPNDDLIRDTAKSALGPVVLVNRRVRGVASSVVVDDEAGSLLATEHLLEMGHRALVGIFGPPEVDTSRRRRKGFTSAAEAAGCPAVTISTPNWSEADGYAGALEALDEHPETTAIYASTLLMGIGVLHAAQDRGLVVPRDLSVISLHDSEVAQYLNPSLTTVAMPTEELGATAVDVLVGRIEGRRPRHVKVAGTGELIRRESVAPPPTAA